MPLSVTVTKLIARCAVLTITWTLATYLFTRGASNLDNSSDVTALFGCHGNFVYILSWIVLQQQFVSARVGVYFMQLVFQITTYWGME
jgi:hypothetical protein